MGKQKSAAFSRSKGKRGERQVAKLFQQWWGGEFGSTPLSGGWSNKSMRDGKQLAGDLMTPDDSFPFCVEVKNCEGWHLEQLLTSPKCDFFSWWNQTLEETTEGKIPFLIFTRNHQPWYVALQLPIVEQNAIPGQAFTFEGIYITLADNFFATDKETWRHVKPIQEKPSSSQQLTEMQEVWECAFEVQVPR